MLSKKALEGLPRANGYVIENNLEPSPVVGIRSNLDLSPVASDSRFRSNSSLRNKQTNLEPGTAISKGGDLNLRF